MSAKATPTAAKTDSADEKALIESAKLEGKSPFDYIIVGSGAGGGPLAARLALANKKVLLIEAGGDPKEELREAARKDLAKRGKEAKFQNPEDALAIEEAPIFHGASTEDPNLSWQFSVRHYDNAKRQVMDHKYDPRRDPTQGEERKELEKHYLERWGQPMPDFDPSLPGSPPAGSKGKGGIFYKRSAGIGGCTGHHAMIVIKPNDHDWNEIAALTNDQSWSAKNMQPYFARMEQCLYVDEYGGFLSNTLGWFYKAFQAILRFINPKAVLDEGGHGKEGWQPTSFISLDLVQRIVKTDKEFSTLLIKSAFKVIEKSGPLTATLKRFLITLGFVRALDPNDDSTRANNPKGGVFLIPIGTGGGGGPQDNPVVDEHGSSLKGCRVGVREFILKTQKQVNSRPESESGRLCIEKEVHVQRVIFDNSTPPRAVGVVGVKGRHLYRASPLSKAEDADQPGEPTPYFVSAGEGEVILCGGSFNTPQLLTLSGIGDVEEHRKLGITVPPLLNSGGDQVHEAINLPGVGRNLQDRYEVTVISELNEPLKTLNTLSFDPTSTTDKLLDEWRKHRTGLCTSNGGTLAILQRSSTAAPDRPGADFLTFGAPAGFRGYYWNYSKQLLRPYRDAPNDPRNPNQPWTWDQRNDQTNLWTWVILKAYTRNNGGTVRLRSSDPLDTPVINFHSFDSLGKASTVDWEKDVEAMAEMVESMRKINAQPGSPFKREIQPKEYIEQNKMSLQEWIKNEAWGHHACGTCRIGSDPWQAKVTDLKDKHAVLDSHFRVHGVKGLRVVDASVFPKIPGYFILAPIFMMSEKAAETILSEHVDINFPDAVSAFELDAIKTRRANAWVDSDNKPIPVGLRYAAANTNPPLPTGDAEDDEHPAPPPSSSTIETLNKQSIVGLALSGGGVRSSTFSLGVVQALASKGRLRHIDYLSTVSGGAFTGGFLGRLFTHKGVADVADPCGRAEELIKDNDSGPLRWLRTQANYLFVNGSSDALTALAVYFRNVFTVHLVVGALLVACFGLLAGVSQWSLYEKLIPHAPALPTWKTVTPMLSLWWWLPLAMLALVIIPMKLGFWLAPKRQSYRSHPPHPLAAWIILIAGASIGLSLQGNAQFAGAGLVILGLAWIWQEAARSDIDECDIKSRRAEGIIVRNRLTRGLGEALLVFLILVLWVIIDSTARTIASPRVLSAMIGTLIALAPLLNMLRSKAMDLLPKSKGADAAVGKMKVLGVVIALVLLVVADVIAHVTFTTLEPKWAWGTVALALAFSLAIGRAFDFLNLTSLSSTYGARIIRTFLGASNPSRTQGAENMAADVQVAHADDDLPHSKYRPEENGGPLHLISVCVNETVDHASQREIRERKGLLMTIGSFGVSVGRRYFSLWSKTIDEPRWLKSRRWLEGVDLDGDISPTLQPIIHNSDPNTFHPLGRRDNKNAVVQSLTLGDWIAVSGAAFSTGNGRSTNPLLALFMGILNVRLGFWWDTGIRATERRGRFPANAWRRLKELPGTLFRTQQLLLAEWKGRFDGPSQEFWNLSDGGHIDNSSTYELIRRKVPFIICTDATRDIDYSYGDFANLVRNVRVDFGAEIEWVDPSLLGTSGNTPMPPSHVTGWIDLAQIGTLDQIKGNGSHGGPGKKHAALAHIVHADGTDSWLLLIKASLTEKETLDIKQYATSHRDFPQDSTADQIYDDEQWESYRKLGETIGNAVLK